VAIEVDLATARRIALRAQRLDGSAKGVLETVRALGFLQIDPIAVVAPPQHLVLWSRLGPFDVDELARLLWVERKLVEWHAHVWPVETLPLLQARMRRNRRADRLARERWGREFLAANAGFHRAVLQDLEQRGPLLARQIADGKGLGRRVHRWHGARHVVTMLELLHLRGEVAVAGRRSGQRVWDLAERWYPPTESVPLRDAERLLADQRFRALGVRLDRGRWIAHPQAADGPIADRAVLLSPFDRLVYDRARAEALFDFRYRLEMYVTPARREFGYYVLPLLVGDEIVGRAEPRFDRRTRTLELVGAWGDRSRLGEALAQLAACLVADRMVERR
jgi:uncharacterized protein YcaQ